MFKEALSLEDCFFSTNSLLFDCYSPIQPNKWNHTSLSIAAIIVMILVVVVSLWLFCGYIHRVYPSLSFDICYDRFFWSLYVLLTYFSRKTNLLKELYAWICCLVASHHYTTFIIKSELFIPQITQNFLLKLSLFALFSLLMFLLSF